MQLRKQETTSLVVTGVTGSDNLSTDIDVDTLTGVGSHGSRKVVLLQMVEVSLAQICPLMLMLTL